MLATSTVHASEHGVCHVGANVVELERVCLCGCHLAGCLRVSVVVLVVVLEEVEEGDIEEVDEEEERRKERKRGGRGGWKRKLKEGGGWKEMPDNRKNRKKGLLLCLSSERGRRLRDKVIRELRPSNLNSPQPPSPRRSCLNKEASTCYPPSSPPLLTKKNKEKDSSK